MKKIFSILFFAVLALCAIGQKSDGFTPDKGQTQCKKASTLYTVVDNTGTRFNWTAEILLTFSDGSTAVITQTPTTGWTQQLNQWVTIFGDAVSAKCEQSLTEARCNFLPNGCGGLLPPPTELQGTINQMFARYLQILACPTCPALVDAEVISVNGTPFERKLVMKFVPGQEQRYDLCQACGKEGTLYYQGTDDIVPPEDYPICLFDCSEQLPPVPETACNFTLIEACDDGVELTPGVFKTIQIQFADCGDGNVVDNIYEVDADGALVEYTLVGSAVNCDSGLEVEPPKPELDCGSFTGNCMCYGAQNSDDTYSYVNSDNTTEGTFSMNTTNMKWDVSGGDGSLDGSTTYANNCIDDGGEATFMITDQDGNIVTFTANAYTGTPPNAFYTGTGVGGFSGKVREVTITCSTSSSEGGKACQWMSCDKTVVKWFDGTKELTAEEIETLTECTQPVYLEPECAVNTIQLEACAAEDVAGQATTGDLILTVATQDCNNVILSSTQYNITTGNTELTEAVSTTSCDPQPDVTQTEECLRDTENVEWTEITIVQGASVTVIYVNQDNLQIGTPAGSPADWKACSEFTRKSVGVNRCCTYNGTNVWITDYDDGSFDVLDISLNTVIASPDISLLDCCKEMVVTTNDVGVLFAYGQQNLNTTGDTFNSSIARTAVGQYSVTFGQAHPNGTDYAITFGQEEEAARDVAKVSVVEGTRTANGFDLIVTVDDNGGSADIYVDEPFSFKIAIDQTVVTEITNN